jgi:hypothetical protein
MLVGKLNEAKNDWREKEHAENEHKEGERESG